MQLEAQLRLHQTCLWCYKGGIRLFSQSNTYRKPANYYQLLGVKSDATTEEIKNAFFGKSKKLHPDSDPSNPALHSQFVKLNEAYTVLSKERSRKEYDFKLGHQYNTHHGFGSTSSPTDYSNNFSSESYENIRYWEQFRQSNGHDRYADARQKSRSRNLRFVGYCIIAMMVSLGVHFLLFRKLREVHNNFMDEKDRMLTKIYNESKERARINGFKKQTEIMRQKHAEFLKKYKMRGSGEE